MTFLVPFDGSELAEAALSRADEYARALDETVVCFGVVPEGKRYAREKGWIGPDEAFDAREVVRAIRERATGIAPDAAFEHERVDASATSGTIATRIRKRARREDVSVVFLGSENVGSVAAPVSSVGRSVASGQHYDIYIVRHRAPPEIGGLRRKAGFYRD